MRIFNYKLATYLPIGDVAGLQNALFRRSCRVNGVCSGIPGSYMVGLRLLVSVSFLAVMSPVDMIFKYVC